MALPPPRTLRTKRNFKALQLPTGPTLNLAPIASPSQGFRRPPPLAGATPAASSSSSSSSSSTATTTLTLTTTAGPSASDKTLPALPPPPHPLATSTSTVIGTPLPSALNPNAPLPSTGETPVTSQQRSAIRATITQTITNFPRKSLDLQNEKLVHIREIGQGNGGSVSLVRHRDTDIIMAKKIVLIDAKPSVRKQIVRELQIMHECNSSYIIECYGSYLADPNICICMEYMDRGSFDSIYKKIGPIPIEVVGKVAVSVLKGLTYLYDVHRIIHRDIKPSNILCNTKGEIKLCDFGVSGELINSIANTFVGTSIYMSPERIQGAEYSVKSDVWSLGITLIELATGRFPFSDSGPDDGYDHPDTAGLAGEHNTTSNGTSTANNTATSPSSPHGLPDLDEETVMIITAATASLDLNPFANLTTTTTVNKKPPSPRTHTHTHGHTPTHSRKRSVGVSLHGGGMTMSIIELMHRIIHQPAPRLPDGRFGGEADEFVAACLEKEVEMRRTPAVLLERFRWVRQQGGSGFDVGAWARGI